METSQIRYRLTVTPTSTQWPRYIPSRTMAIISPSTRWVVTLKIIKYHILEIACNHAVYAHNVKHVTAFFIFIFINMLITLELY